MRGVKLLLALLVAATPLAAQPTPTLEPGARVRVTVGGAQPRVQVGVHQLVSDSALVLQSDSASFSIPLDLVTRVEVSRGRESHWLAGAAVGFVVGLVVVRSILHSEGGSGGSTAMCDQERNQDSMSSGECHAITVAGVAAATGLGAGIGGLIMTDLWQDVPVERLRPTMAPPLGRTLGLKFAVSF